MRLGPLRHRATFQARKTGRDGFGQPVDGWDDVVTTWVSIEPLNGRELLRAQQTQSVTTHRIRCRYQAGLESSKRMVFGSRVFDLQSVINPAEIGAQLEIMANEGLTDG